MSEAAHIGRNLKAARVRRLLTQEELAEIGGRIVPLLAAGVDVFAYFRHEDAPTAPLYAARLLELVRGDEG